MDNRPTLKGLVSGLQPKGTKPTVVELEQANTEPERPMADMLDATVEPTQYELELEFGQSMPARRGINPRLPYLFKGQVEVSKLSEVELKPMPTMIKQKLNNAIAKAKLGKRLTLAERRLLGKHNLARIMVRLRPKSGDLG